MGLNRQQRAVYDTLREFTGQNIIFVLPRVLVRLCGGWEEAAMLSQIIRWSNPDRRDGWFYKTRLDFAVELELTEKQVRRCRDNLERLGFIETRIMRVGNSPTTWYRSRPELVLGEYEKHRPKRADHRPPGAAAPAQTGQSLNITSMDIHQNTRARIGALANDDSGLSPDEEAEMTRLWDEALKTPTGQLFLGLTRSTKGDNR